MASRAQIIETSHNTRASAAGECISSSDNEEEEQITEPGSSKPTEHRNTIAGIDSSASSASVVSGIERPTICRYFLTGSCRFGNWCRNLHSTESDSIQIPNNSIEFNNNNSKTSSNIDPNKWIMAKEFVPSWSRKTTVNSNVKNLDVPNTTNEGNLSTDESKSYAEIVGVPNLPIENIPSTSYQTSMLCPYIQYVVNSVPETSEASDTKQMNSESEGVEKPRSDTVSIVTCPYGEHCTYQHGELCDMCGEFALHPTDMEQRKQHQNECIRQHELDMELSFAIARSRDKTCGICYETVLDKTSREKQRFGILPNCNHVFCVQCIRTWRQAKNFDTKATRSCPVCRKTSDFICPSNFWVETQEEKNKLIEDYKSALREKHCKYYKQGDGKCPFGNNCFYKHALPNGTLVDVGKPKREARRVFSDRGVLDIDPVALWTFMEFRDSSLSDEEHSLLAELYLNVLSSITSNDDNSDLSDSDDLHYADLVDVTDEDEEEDDDDEDDDDDVDDDEVDEDDDGGEEDGIRAALSLLRDGLNLDYIDSTMPGSSDEDQD